MDCPYYSIQLTAVCGVKRPVKVLAPNAFIATFALEVRRASLSFEPSQRRQNKAKGYDSIAISIRKYEISICE
jgi:hypothetical protein